MKYRVWIGKDLLNDEGTLKETVEKATSLKLFESKDENKEGGENADAQENVATIKLTEYEVIGMKIAGFAATNTGNTDNATTGVKKKPDYKLTITSRIRSSISLESLFGGLSTFATSMGILPTETDIANKITTVKDKFQSTYKIQSLEHGVKLAGMVAGSGLGSVDTFLNTKNNSAENCIAIKEWFSMYKEDKKDDKKEDENKNNKNQTPEEKKEAEVAAAAEEKKINDKVYRDVYIEIVLSDVQSFYYHFPNMYIDKFEEDYTDQEGTCKYTIELLGHFHKEQINEKEFKHVKVSYSDKLNNGFKKLKSSLGLDRKPSVTSGSKKPNTSVGSK